MMILHPILRNAIAFVLLLIAMQWISDSISRTGPLDLIETYLLPHIIRTTGTTYNDGNSLERHNNYGYDFMTCPPDEWIDPAFAVRDKSNGKHDDEDSLYSEKFDPRNKVATHSYFPLCALQGWVKLGGGGVNSCQMGEEYVTIIRAKTLQKYRYYDTAKIVNTGGDDSGTVREHNENEQENRIPRILHISSPTNCLPIPTVQVLSRIVGSATSAVERTQSQKQPRIHHNHHHPIESQQLVIFIHSHQAMQTYLFKKEFPIFPEVKEGILCGMGKLKAALRKAVYELLSQEQDAVEEAAWMQRIIDEIAFGVQRDIWRYLILWEYGGVAMDISTLHAILLDGDDDNVSNSRNDVKNTANATTNSESGDARIQKLMTQWWNTNETNSDALIYFISNYFDNGEFITPQERIPLTNILGAAPRHPFIYFSAKSALRYAIWDEEKSISTHGRTTKIPPIYDGLNYVNSDWQQIKTGGIVTVLGYDISRNNSIHLLNGNDVLPISLTSPNRTPWRSIFTAFSTSMTGKDGGRNINTNDMEGNYTVSMPSEAKIMEVMQRIASEQTYFSTKSLFSCMEYRLDMYMQK